MFTRAFYGTIALLVSSTAFGQPHSPGVVARIPDSSEVTAFSGYLCAALSPNALHVALCDEQGRYELREATGKRLATLHERHLKGNTPRWSSDSRWLYIADEKGVAAWDVAARRKMHVFDAKTHIDRAPEIALSQDGKTLVASWPGMTICWDVTRGHERWRHHGSHGIALSPGGEITYLVHAGISVQLVESQSGNILRRWPLKENERVAFCSDRCSVSADGKYLAVWSDRGIVRLLDTRSGVEVRRIETGQDFGIALAFSPDGHWLATGGPKNALRIWETDTGLELAQVPGHRRFLMNIEWSADGWQALSCSGDLTAILWNLLPPVQRERLTALNQPAPSGLYETIGAIAHDARWIEYFMQQIPPVPMQPSAQIDKLLHDLDARRHPIREQASRTLATHGRLVEPALKDFLKTTDSTEVQIRIQRLLDQIPRELSPDELMHRRVVKAVSLSTSPLSRKALEHWSGGAPGAVLTQEAKLALQRMK